MDIDELIRQIKDQAKQLEHEQPLEFQAEVINTVAAPDKKNTLEKKTRTWHLYDLIFYDNETFLNKAYQVVLQRQPDEIGLENALRYLQKGGSKQSLLADMMLSDEGLQHQVDIDGVDWYLFRARLLRKLGYAGRILKPLVILPDHIFKPRLMPIIHKIMNIEEQNTQLQQQLQEQRSQLQEHNEELIGQLQEQRSQLQEHNEELIGQLQEQRSQLQEHNEELIGQLQEQRSQLQEHNEELIGQLQEQRSQLQEHNEELIGQLQEQRSQLQEHNEELIGQLQEQHSQLQEQHSKFQKHNEKLIGKLQEQNQQLENHLAQVRMQFNYQQRNQDAFLQELIDTTYNPDEGNNKPESVQPVLQAHQNDKLDAYYVVFEDACRGSREQIRSSLSNYLPYIRQARDTLELPDSEVRLMDLGCGRGEWLGLLNEQGWQAEGVDINKVMVQDCVNKGLSVVQQDVISYLKQQSSDSILAVTAFHIIEHIPFASLLSLFEESIRVLKPGGLIIFETPNVENILVGSHTFYHDPTHRNPVTPTSVQFLAHYIGFCQVEIVRLHPYPEEARLPGHDPVTERLNGHLCGPQDYAIIAHKPEPEE